MLRIRLARTLPLVLILLSADLAAQEPLVSATPFTDPRPVESGREAQSEPAAAQELPSQASQQFQQMITEIVRDNLPHEYEKLDGWGDTREIFDGVYVKLDGLRLQTHRRKKAVNHGTWKMYRVTLVNPEDTFQIRVGEIQEPGNGRIHFSAEVDASLHVFGRISEWNRGVQLYSVSANADAGVRLRIDCNLGLKLNPLKLPPDVILDPAVTAADVQLTAFRLHNISDLHGPVVRELGREVRDIVEDKLAKDRGKLVTKINGQIDKNRDKLTLSLQDVITSKWGNLAAKQLGVEQ